MPKLTQLMSALTACLLVASTTLPAAQADPGRYGKGERHGGDRGDRNYHHDRGHDRGGHDRDWDRGRDHDRRHDNHHGRRDGNPYTSFKHGDRNYARHWEKANRRYDQWRYGYASPNQWLRGDHRSRTHSMHGYRSHHGGYGYDYYRPRYSVGGHYYRSHRTVIVNDYHRHGLRHPPRGYHWVRDNDSGDAILASVATGAIIGLVVGILASEY